MSVVAVIPAYNEAERIQTALRDALPYVDHVVVVDDCSRDNTAEVAFHEGVYVLRHVVNRGQGAALQTGAEFALQRLGAEIIVHFDADGQMRGDEIPQLIDPIRSGEVEIVLGSRFMGKAAKGMPMSRLATLKAALAFTRLVSGIKVSDPQCGFRAFSRNAAPYLRLRQDRAAHASEILDLVKASKLKFVCHPVEIRYTDDTLAKGTSFLDGFKILKDYFTNKFF